jgi:hypothetical protein
MTRDRQIDVCAQCHGGRRFPVRASFSYVSGEPLDQFYVRDPASSSASPDVHGSGAVHGGLMPWKFSSTLMTTFKLWKSFVWPLATHGISGLMPGLRKNQGDT